MSDDVDVKPLPQLPALNIPERYYHYSVELFSEAVKQMAKIMRVHSSPRGQLILTLEHLISALREQPFKPVTEYERLVRERALELLDIADLAVNGPDTTEGRAKLFLLVSELKKAGF